MDTLFMNSENCKTSDPIIQLFRQDRLKEKW